MLHAPTKSEKLAYLVQDCPEYLVTAAVAGEGGSCTAATAVGLAAAGGGGSTAATAVGLGSPSVPKGLITHTNMTSKEGIFYAPSDSVR